MTYPVCQDKSPDTPSGTAATYHIEYIPSIFIIDRNGKIIAEDPPDLAKAVKKALAKKANAPIIQVL